MLDETFRKMQIQSFECQKHAVCEAHKLHSDKKSIEPFVRRITYIFGYLFTVIILKIPIAKPLIGASSSY